MSVRGALKRVALWLPPLRRVFEQRDEARSVAGAALEQLATARSLVAQERSVLENERSSLARERSLRQELEGENAILRRDIDWLRTVDGLVYRMSLFDLGDTDLEPSSATADPPHIIDERFRHEFRRVLEHKKVIPFGSTEVGLSHYEADIYDHVEGRYRIFAGSIIPWLKSVALDMARMTALEIGSGTGASSLAFATEVGRLVCFEIDRPAVAAARERLAWFGHDNVDFVESPFGRNSEFVKAGNRANLVVMCAVLEHMTLDEAVDALRTAWECLLPGGLLLIADTPNRFSPFDGHTALLPLFSTLPRELKRVYANASPREGFRNDVAQAGDNDIDMLLTRWGSGISYHEFEVALGKGVHDYVVLDGYEPQIRAISNLALGDAVTRFVFDRFGTGAHRAFTRSNLYFVLRKPSDDSPGAENVA